MSHCPVTGAQGECTKGKWTCAGGNKSCAPAHTKQSEVCDGKDNDCNGIIDDRPTDVD